MMSGIGGGKRVGIRKGRGRKERKKVWGGRRGKERRRETGEGEEGEEKEGAGREN